MSIRITYSSLQSALRRLKADGFTEIVAAHDTTSRTFTSETRLAVLKVLEDKRARLDIY